MGTGVSIRAMVTLGGRALSEEVFWGHDAISCFMPSAETIACGSLGDYSLLQFCALFCADVAFR